MYICRTSCTEFVVSYVEKRGSFISAISGYHLTPYRPRNEPLALLSSLFRRFLWPVVTISKWNNEKTMRGSRLADVHSRVYRISKWHRYSKSWQLPLRRKWRRHETTGEERREERRKKNQVSIDIIPPAPRLNHVDKVTYESFLHCGCSPSSPSRFADIALDGCYW